MWVNFLPQDSHSQLAQTTRSCKIGVWPKPADKHDDIPFTSVVCLNSDLKPSPYCIEKYPNTTGLYASQMTMVTNYPHKNYTWSASNVLRTVREEIMASGKFLNLQHEAKFKITKQIHGSSLFTRLTDIFHHVSSNYVALNSKCWTQLELTNDLSWDSLVYAQVPIKVLHL